MPNQLTLATTIPPIMDLNEITREYERYKRELAEKRLKQIREESASPVALGPKTTFHAYDFVAVPKTSK